MIKIFQLIGIILIQYVICSPSLINPEYYIWINYEEKIPISYNFHSSQYSTRLPCQTRIGKCTYQLSVLPPGWEITTSGSLLIPKNDAQKDGIFAIQGTFSQPTGQKINANLVVLIQRGLLSVKDKSEFYKNSGYNVASTATNYQENSLVRKLPEGYPTLQSIQARINNGDISGITATVNQILTKYAPCQSKILYLSSLRRILNDAMNSNTDKIAQNSKQIKQLKLKKASTLAKKDQILLNRGITSQIKNITNQIRKVDGQIAQLKLDINYQTRMSNDSINSISNYNIVTSLLANDSTKIIDNQLVTLDSSIQDYLKKRLAKQIQIINIKKQILNLNEQKQKNKQFASAIQSYIDLNMRKYQMQKQISNTSIGISDLKDKQMENNLFIQLLSQQIDRNKSQASVIDAKSKLKQFQAEYLLLKKNSQYVQVLKRDKNVSC